MLDVNEDTQLLRRRISTSRKTGLVEGLISGRRDGERKKKNLRSSFRAAGSWLGALFHNENTWRTSSFNYLLFEALTWLHR